jgi:hypothetical protein
MFYRGLSSRFKSKHLCYELKEIYSDLGIVNIEEKIPVLLYSRNKLSCGIPAIMEPVGGRRLTLNVNEDINNGALATRNLMEELGSIRVGAGDVVKILPLVPKCPTFYRDGTLGSPDIYNEMK